MSQPIMRVGLSLPCMVPVVPGTPETSAPVEQRTETCNVDGWWIVGRAPICDIHLREVLGDDEVDALFAEVREGGMPGEHPTERLPWAERHRYDQDPESLFDGHPVKEAARSERG